MRGKILAQIGGGTQELTASDRKQRWAGWDVIFVGGLFAAKKACGELREAWLQRKSLRGENWTGRPKRHVKRHEKYVKRHERHVKRPVCRPVSTWITRRRRCLVFVADIEETCFLEIDYLTQCEASLDLGKQTLRVQGEEMPLFPNDDAEQVSCVESRRVTAPAVREKLHQSTGGRSESDAAPVLPGKVRPEVKTEGRGPAETWRISGEMLSPHPQDLTCQSTSRLT
ncbi:hypothetical protein E2C01_050467 [Portunus trituberculatus]|uniref:Uncharacterized protein n=1 Tax=Portunus trituberculatus TaxID=210409 RepID=A0A5B7GG18_PORTR|nr:hypothetical protein [Portunus trituberculatus]